jgi:tRNA modification GTPase
VDTAGLETPRDELEAGAIERTREVLGEADLVLFVVDGQNVAGARPPSGRGPSGGRAAVLEVLNKIDLCPGLAPPGMWPISARTGQGLGELRAAILEALGLPRRGPEAPAVVFTPRQVTALGPAGRDFDSIPESRRRLLRGPP